MLVLTFGLIFIIVVAATWFMGLWSNMLTLINFILAATIASGFFEVAASNFDNSMNDSGDQFAGQYKHYTYLLDFLALWGIFFIAFALLRLATDTLSKYKMKFNFWVEMAGRSVFSVWIAWVFICFSMFTLHTAPLPVDAFGGQFQPTPTSRNLMGIGPDRMWMAFLQSRSQGALSNWEVDASDLHPDDQGQNYQPFDSRGDFIYKYHHRRTVFAEQEQTQVQRAW